MGMFAEASGSGFHPVVSSGGHHEDKSFGWGWIFALVIIFLALVFLWGRRDGGGGIGEIAPIAAVAALNRAPAGGYADGCGSHHEHWDIVRDELREFGVLKKEGAENGWRLSREQDKNHYETGQQICNMKFDLAQQADKNYRDIEARMDQKFFALEKEMWASERNALRDKLFERDLRLNGDRVIGALAPRPPMPSIPVHGPTAYPYPCADGACYGY